MKGDSIMLIMKRRLIISTVCVLAMLAGAILVMAQDSPPPRPRHRDFSTASASGAQDTGTRGPGQRDSMFRFIGSEMHFGGKTVTGAPYSATVTTESTQTLTDGTHITRKTTGAIYRDGEGRTRSEQTLGAVGSFAATGDARKRTFIHDPVAGVQYVLDATARTADKMKARTGPPPGVSPNHVSSTAKERPDVKTESLGTQTIEGVQAEGTRRTFTIPAGKFGNDQPIQIVSESWYSPDLQTIVMSKHSDPRMGEHVYKLTSINRSEPAKSLFEVPADYTVTEKSFGRGPGMRGPRRTNEN
jgi:hypothetical protein